MGFGGQAAPSADRTSPKAGPAPWIALVVGALLLLGGFAVATFFVLRLANDDAGDMLGDLSTGPAQEGPATIPPFEQGNPENPAGDHWHVAFGFYVCEQYLPIFEAPGRDPDGIHTHGDGAIHVHPFHGGAAGVKATMAVFERGAGITLDEDGFVIPGADVREGDDCNGTPGEIRFLVNGDEFQGDPSDYRFADGDVVVMALVAPGDEVPPLPWAEVLQNLSDVPPPV